MTQIIADGYRALDCASLPVYLERRLAAEQLPGGDACYWRVQEVGDGNLNLVFIVQGEDRALVVKQALPYVRVVGEGWPMSLQRAYFEYNALVEQRRVAGKLVPEVYFFDSDMSLLVMEYLYPHTILRNELIAGKVFPSLAQDMATFLANTLFYTSDLGMEAKQKKGLVARFAANSDLCQITEDLIFTEPYYDAPRNNWNSPALDGDVTAMWRDRELIQVAMEYKWKFMTEAQALLHGDLHSGSVMVTTAETRIIDPEFAFYGPIAFDIGNYLANLLIAYFSQRVHRQDEISRHYYQNWLLQQLVETWQRFEQQFRQLWDQKRGLSASENRGDAWPVQLYPMESAIEQYHWQAQQTFFRTLFIDTLVNAGLEMNRRTVGFAGVADLKSIGDPELRAVCERRVLVFARHLIVSPAQYQQMQQVADTARILEDE